MLTFTQKLLRQRNFFNFLIPLFAVFVGLGASQTVQAQVTITSTSVIIQRNGGSNETFNASPSTPMPFNGTNLGSYDINTGQLSLKGGTVTTNETGTVAATAAALNYQVFDFNLNLLTSGSIVLQGGGSTNGNRTFTTSGANIDLVNLARPIGVGTPYYLTVNFSTQQRIGFNVSDGPKDDNGGKQYVATYSITNTPPAQVSTATLRNVIVTSGTTAANATTHTYDATANTPGPNVFNGTNFGVLDASTGRLLLQGGSIQITEKNGDTFDKALIDFVVTPGDFTSAFVSTDQTLQLVQTGYNAATMTRTFSLTNAARNVLALAMTGGAGTSYRFDISVSASGNNSVGNGISIQGLRQRSVFTVTGTPIVMPTLTNTTLFVSPSNGLNVTYDANNVSANTDFNGANLGTFDISNGQLVLNGGGATTTENGPNQISNVTLYFRVRQTGTGGGGYTPLALMQTSITTNAAGSSTRTFALDNAA